MKNYTKALAEQIVAVMDRYNNYEELEKIVICYGMELFLNSILTQHKEIYQCIAVFSAIH